MIQKWLRRIGALLILALLAMTVLHRDRYRSLLFDHEAAAPAAAAEPAAAE